MNRQARRKAAAIDRVQQKSKKKMTRKIVNTLAAGSVGFVGLSASHVVAQPMPTGTACTVAGNIATCTGDQSDGIIAGDDFPLDGVDTLIVKDLTAAIAPRASIITPIYNTPLLFPPNIPFMPNNAPGSYAYTSTGYYSYTSNGANGIDFIVGSGDITVESDTGTYGINTNGRGINVSTGDGGNINITSAGDIDSDGTAINASVYGDGDITITNSGELDSDDDEGISAYNYSGKITITNTGDIFADDGGISAYSYGGSVKKVMDLTATAESVENDAGSGVVIDNSGDINTGGVAIDVRSRTSAGDITITNTGTAVSRSAVISARTYGDGNIAVTNSGAAGAYFGSAIEVYTSGSGDVSINNSAADIPDEYANPFVASTISFNSAAISVRSVQRIDKKEEYYGPYTIEDVTAMEVAVEAGDVDIQNSANLLSGRSGIDSYARYGNTTIENTGDITIISNLGYLYGAFDGGYDYIGQPDFIAANKGPSISGGLSFGINARTDEGDLDINNTGDITFGQFTLPPYIGDYGPDVLAPFASDQVQSFNVSAQNEGPPSLNEGQSIGINAQNYFGNIKITNSGNLTFGESFDLGELVSYYDYGDYSGAAYAQQDGEITAANIGPFPLPPMVNGSSIGINAQSSSRRYAGPIAINNSGDITINQIISNNYDGPYIGYDGPYVGGDFGGGGTISVANFGPPQIGHQAILVFLRVMTMVPSTSITLVILRLQRLRLLDQYLMVGLSQ